MWVLTVRDKATQDLTDACEWYESKRSGLGSEFLADAASTFEKIEQLPESYPVYHRGARRALMRRFPYKVFFIVNGESVVVLRVLHASRDHRREI
jgi:plasmid stabilization system protein ParE